MISSWRQLYASPYRIDLDHLVEGQPYAMIARHPSDRNLLWLGDAIRFDHHAYPEQLEPSQMNVDGHQELLINFTYGLLDYGSQEVKRWEEQSRTRYVDSLGLIRNRPESHAIHVCVDLKTLSRLALAPESLKAAG